MEHWPIALVRHVVIRVLVDLVRRFFKEVATCTVLHAQQIPTLLMKGDVYLVLLDPFLPKPLVRVRSVPPDRDLIQPRVHVWPVPQDSILLASVDVNLVLREWYPRVREHRNAQRVDVEPLLMPQEMDVLLVLLVSFLPMARVLVSLVLLGPFQRLVLVLV